jgi:hypothetical protein
MPHDIGNFMPYLPLGPTLGLNANPWDINNGMGAYNIQGLRSTEDPMAKLLKLPAEPYNLSYGLPYGKDAPFNFKQQMQIERLNKLLGPLPRPTLRPEQK